jgi:hypothetical protein
VGSSQRITITNEVELEHARLQCVTPADEGPSAPTVGSQLAGEMRVRFARKDFAGALAVAETILASHGGNPEVQGCAEACRSRLMASYVASIGSLQKVPVVAAPLDEVHASTVDHRAGFVLAQVDGATNLEEILDVCGMSSLDALRIVSELARRQIIVFRGATAAVGAKTRRRNGET